MKSKLNTLSIIAIVSLLHILLGWSMSRMNFDFIQFEELGNLQMVEVNLGVEPQPQEEMIEPDTKPEITPPKEEIITQEVKEPADLVKEEPKKDAPPPKKVETPKPKPKIVEKKQPKPKPPKQAPKQQMVKKKSSNVENTKSNLPVGNANGREGSSSTQGNSNTNAALGAGYGKAMIGRCSDISDEADDQGSVKLGVTINESGKATNVDILSSSGIKRLDNQAKRMASSHTYSPAKANGKAVVGKVEFSINFKCGNAA
ncbi:energy transducer TonB [Otariodibacter oris]|uniref:Outer membrane transport energization protein TonB n=1 Tax=Otariodibacter oris TaxID=1032623 RepID=A0A420XI50_9PAST|nr:energy transducer TonB [Otariodibacter oris]QGM80992.1 hypothetical protein A6A10_06025 [Otariodibacter oris]RKR76828.1 outer membrane transport energization protein TonB [Otariodibacter oris]